MYIYIHEYIPNYSNIFPEIVFKILLFEHFTLTPYHLNNVLFNIYRNLRSEGTIRRLVPNFLRCPPSWWWILTSIGCLGVGGFRSCFFNDNISGGNGTRHRYGTFRRKCLFSYFANNSRFVPLMRRFSADVQKNLPDLRTETQDQQHWTAWRVLRRISIIIYEVPLRRFAVYIWSSVTGPRDVRDVSRTRS